jgi:hypothetical protein
MDWNEAAANVPKQSSSGYMKFDKEGTFKFRILSAPVSGYEYWTIDKEPIRSKEYPKVISDKIKPGDKIKFFWAFVVWNFQAEEVQILELTQSTIIDRCKLSLIARSGATQLVIAFPSLVRV